MAEDWKLQVSYKVGQDMINIRANTGAELTVLLGDISDKELATQIAAVAKQLNGANALAPLSTGGSTQEREQPQHSGTDWAPPASAGVQKAAPSCIHGLRTYKSGIAKASGKPYAFWSCPLPQGPDQCKPAN